MNKHYDDIYKANNNVFGNEPTPILKMAVNLYQVSGQSIEMKNFLDIGAGQGRDSLYMANLGFKVRSVDSSAEACRQLSKTIEHGRIKNITVQNVDAEDCIIDENKYNIISVINVLHFLEKKSSLQVINNIKNSLTSGGLAVISSYISKNCFQENELLKIFEDFKVLYYFESIIEDNGHPGRSEKHTHFVTRIIARKI